MRAILLKAFGPPDALVPEDVPDPVAGPGQALIRVSAVSITLIDTAIRAGNGPTPAHRPALPVIPGNGVGGTVIAVGDAVDTSLIGRRVVSTTGGSGGYAELVAVDAAEPIPVPDGLRLTDAVALLADGRTALALVRAVPPAPGEWVLVEAAGGGVGSLLVQLVARGGARVIAAARGARKLELARELGAELAVDYSLPGWTEEVRAATGGGVDVVFDGVGGDIGRAALELVKDGGRFCVVGGSSGSMTAPSEDDVQRRRLRLIGVWSVGRSSEGVRTLAATALAEAAAGRLRPTIGQTFPLGRAADAHAAIEARATVGKTLLIP